MFGGVMVEFFINFSSPKPAYRVFSNMKDRLCRGAGRMLLLIICIFLMAVAAGKGKSMLGRSR